MDIDTDRMTIEYSSLSIDLNKLHHFYMENWHMNHVDYMLDQ